MSACVHGKRVLYLAVYMKNVLLYAMFGCVNEKCITDCYVLLCTWKMCHCMLCLAVYMKNVLLHAMPACVYENCVTACCVCLCTWKVCHCMLCLPVYMKNVSLHAMPVYMSNVSLHDVHVCLRTWTYVPAECVCLCTWKMCHSMLCLPVYMEVCHWIMCTFACVHGNVSVDEVSACVQYKLLRKVIILASRPPCLLWSSWRVPVSIYEKNYSTEIALLHVTKTLLSNADKKEGLFTLYSWPSLVRWLKTTFGIFSSTLKWVTSYISGQSNSERGVYNHTVSKPSPLKYGVLQGLVLGPVLFRCYTLPLSGVIEEHDCDYHKYASRIGYAIVGPPFITAQLSTDVVSVCVLIRLWKQHSVQARMQRILVSFVLA